MTSWNSHICPALIADDAELIELLEIWFCVQLTVVIVFARRYPSRPTSVIIQTVLFIVLGRH